MLLASCHASGSYNSEMAPRRLKYVFTFTIIFACIIYLITLSTTRLHNLRVLDEIMSVDHWWNYTDGEKPKYSVKKLSQCHFVLHKSHTFWP
jgi:hypothetical protein